MRSWLSAVGVVGATHVTLDAPALGERCIELELAPGDTWGAVKEKVFARMGAAAPVDRQALINDGKPLDDAAPVEFDAALVCPCPECVGLPVVARALLFIKPGVCSGC